MGVPQHLLSLLTTICRPPHPFPCYGNGGSERGQGSAAGGGVGWGAGGSVTCAALRGSAPQPSSRTGIPARRSALGRRWWSEGGRPRQLPTAPRKSALLLPARSKRLCAVHFENNPAFASPCLAFPTRRAGAPSNIYPFSSPSPWLGKRKRSWSFPTLGAQLPRLLT